MSAAMVQLSCMNPDSCSVLDVLGLTAFGSGFLEHHLGRLAAVPHPFDNVSVVNLEQTVLRGRNQNKQTFSFGRVGGALQPRPSARRRAVLRAPRLV